MSARVGSLTRLVAGLCAAGAVASAILAGQIPEPRKQFGAGITPSYEGWYTRPDGSRNFVVGYYNRNTEQELDVPVGPNNRMDPGGPDLGQPAHFLPGRQLGVFVVPVPAGFKPADQLAWTLTINGQTTTIPLRLNPLYEFSPFSDAGSGNTPPIVRLEQNGKTIQGPISTMASAQMHTAAVSAPLALTVWVADDARATSGSNTPPAASRAPVTIRWSKYRGPGNVTFDAARPTVRRADKAAGETAVFTGSATANATFSAPGDYVLLLVVNDYSGEGGLGSGAFGCCWTTAFVKVTVK